MLPSRSISVGVAPIRSIKASYICQTHSLTGAFAIERVAGQVDFPDELGRDGIEPVCCIEAEVVRADGHVVDVDQQLAAGTAGEFAKEARFAPLMIAER